MSMGNDKLKYLIDNGYKEIKPTLIGFHPDSNFYFNYTIKQTFDFYKLIIDCEIFYNDVIEFLSEYYGKIPEDYNETTSIIVIFFFIPLPKENKNNFTIYLKNVEIFKKQKFDRCSLSINNYMFEAFFDQIDNPTLNPNFEKIRTKTIEKIVNYSSCLPFNQYRLSSRRLLGSENVIDMVDDNLYSDFSNDYIDAEIIKKIDEKIENSNFTDKDVALFYYLLNYYYSHEKK